MERRSAMNMDLSEGRAFQKWVNQVGYVITIRAKNIPAFIAACLFKAVWEENWETTSGQSFKLSGSWPKLAPGQPQS